MGIKYDRAQALEKEGVYTFQADLNDRSPLAVYQVKLLVTERPCLFVKTSDPSAKESGFRRLSVGWKGGFGHGNLNDLSIFHPEKRRVTSSFLANL